MNDYQHLTCAIERDVAIVTMNRPQRRNALSQELMQELMVCLQSLGSDRAVRAVILAAAGKVFCSGHDLSEMVGNEMTALRALFDACSRLMQLVQSIPQPVIAEVQGMATAAGCQLVASCDLAVASEEATFATPGVRIGLFCTTPMVAVTRAIGRKRAMQMLMTGEAIDASTAAEWGLVNKVVASEVLRTETRQLARRVAEASPLTVSIGKQAFYAQIDLDQARAYAYGTEVMTVNALTEDAQEGMRAFLEKRTPTWVGH